MNFWSLWSDNRIWGRCGGLRQRGGMMKYFEKIGKIGKKRRSKRKARSHPNLAFDREKDSVVPPSLSGDKRVFVTCHYCGFSPSRIPPGGVCPKCGGHSWERFALASKLLSSRKK